MFKPGQQVTVIDGGWIGTVESINAEMEAAIIRFPDRPDTLPYAFEALTSTRMTRDEFDTRVRTILDKSHEVTALLHILMTDIGEDAGTEEWCWLYEISRNAGSVSGQLYNSLYPRKSALVDDDA